MNLVGTISTDRSNKDYASWTPKLHHMPSCRLSCIQDPIDIHIHDLPKITPLPIVLCTRIASPPILHLHSLADFLFRLHLILLLTFLLCCVSALHVRSQDARYATLTFRRRCGVEVGAVEAESDIDACIEGGRRCVGWRAWWRE